MLKKNLLKIQLGALMLVSFAIPQLSYADWSIGIGVGDHRDDRDHHFDRDHRDDHRFYGWHNRPSWGYHMHFLPDGYFTVWVDGRRYFYSDGLYYLYVGDGDYVIVNPPIGAYVNVIPPDFQPVSINGRLYYTNGGVYYLLTEHHGYKVVPAPVVYEQPQQVVVTPQQIVVSQPEQQVVVTTQAPAPVQDAFPVNVPNNNGGYTSVIIKKTNKGYEGPQGEFYANFPSVAQLKAMYAK